MTNYKSNKNDYCGILIHKIYDSALSFLENTQLRLKKRRELYHFAFHEKTKEILIKELNFSREDIEEQENFFNEQALNSPFCELIQDVPRALYNELKKNNDTESIFKHRIVPLPSFIENALICEALEKQFTKEQILSCDGFIEERCQDEKGNYHSAIRLNISRKIIRNGFIIPIYRKGMIAGLKVFRYPNDERPFILRSQNNYYRG